MAFPCNESLMQCKFIQSPIPTCEPVTHLGQLAAEGPVESLPRSVGGGGGCVEAAGPVAPSALVAPVHAVLGPVADQLPAEALLAAVAEEAASGRLAVLGRVVVLADLCGRIWT